MALSTEDEVRLSLAGFLHQTPDALAAAWTRVIHDANEAAYHEIVGHFIRKGYTCPQIDTWDRGALYNRLIAVYFCAVFGQALCDAGVATALIDKMEKWLDRLYEMTDIEDGCEIVTPNDSQSIVGHGDLSTGRDMFVQDMEDPRRGEPTEW